MIPRSSSWTNRADGLDIESRRDIWEFIQSLKKRGKTILLTTHDIQEAGALADRITSSRGPHQKGGRNIGLFDGFPRGDGQYIGAPVAAAGIAASMSIANRQVVFTDAPERWRPQPGIPAAMMSRDQGQPRGHLPILPVWERMSIKPFLTLFSMECPGLAPRQDQPLLRHRLAPHLAPHDDPGDPLHEQGKHGRYPSLLLPSCMALVTLSAMISLAIRIAVKKEAGILQRLKVVPFPVFAYFAVQFLCAIAMSLLGLACICILAFIMKMPLKFSPFALALLFLLCCFCFSAIGFFIAGISWKIARRTS
jgi:hypothetical protein